MTDERSKDLCYYHGKIVEGLVDARGVVVPPGARRPHVKGSDVVSDEQREMAAMLRQMGAPREVVQQAMTKELYGGAGDKRSHGSGVKRGRLREATP